MADKFRKNKSLLTPVMKRICRLANRGLNIPSGTPVQNAGKTIHRQDSNSQIPSPKGIEPELFTIGWYPSNRSCANIQGKRLKPQHMPPLMVRKPEWRR
jgi:hypothetical protein